MAHGSARDEPGSTLARWLLLPAGMKAIGLLVLALSAPAFAGDPPPPAMQLPKLNCGESYVLGGRRVSVPRASEPAPVKRHELGDQDIAKVVTDHLGDIQHCWNKLPAKQRFDSTAVLRMSVAPRGDVLDVMLGGDVPEGAKQCMIAAVGRWMFPATDVPSQVEYPVALRAL
jgi:hypothetical protein